MEDFLEKVAEHIENARIPEANEIATKWIVEGKKMKLEEATKVAESFVETVFQEATDGNTKDIRKLLKEKYDAIPVTVEKKDESTTEPTTAAPTEPTAPSVEETFDDILRGPVLLKVGDEYIKIHKETESFQPKNDPSFQNVSIGSIWKELKDKYGVDPKNLGALKALQIAFGVSSTRGKAPIEQEPMCKPSDLNIIKNALTKRIETIDKQVSNSKVVSGQNTIVIRRLEKKQKPLLEALLKKLDSIPADAKPCPEPSLEEPSKGLFDRLKGMVASKPTGAAATTTLPTQDLEVIKHLIFLAIVLAGLESRDALETHMNTIPFADLLKVFDVTKSDTETKFKLQKLLEALQGHRVRGVEKNVDGAESITSLDTEARGLLDQGKECDEAVRDKEAIAAQLAEKLKELDGMKTLFAELEGKLKDCATVKEELEAQLAGNTATVNSKITDLEAALAAAKEALQKCEEGGNTRATEIEALNKRIGELEGALAAANESLKTAGESTRTKDVEIEGFKKRIGDLEAELATAKAGLQTAAEQAVKVAELEAKLAASEKACDAKESALRERLLVVYNEVKALSGSEVTTVLEEETATPEEIIRGLQQLINTYIASAKNSDNAAKATITDLQAKLLNRPDYDAIKAERDKFARLINEMNNELTEKNTAIETLKEQLRVCEDGRGKLETDAAELTGKVERLEAEVKAEKEKCEALGLTSSDALAALQTQLEEAIKAKAECDSQLATQSAEAATCKESLEAAEAAKTQSAAELEVLKEKLAGTQILLEKVSNESVAQGEDIKRLEAELETLRGQLAAKSAEAAEATTQGSAKNSQIGDLNAQIADLQKQLEEKTSEGSDKNEQITDLQERLASAEAEAAQCAAKAATATSEGSAKNNQITDLNAQIAAMTARISELEGQLQTATARADANEAGKGEIQTQLNACNENKTTYETRIRELEGLLNNCTIEASSLKARMTTLLTTLALDDGLRTAVKNWFESGDNYETVEPRIKEFFQKKGESKPSPSSKETCDFFRFLYVTLNVYYQYIISVFPESAKNDILPFIVSDIGLSFIKSKGTELLFKDITQFFYKLFKDGIELPPTEDKVINEKYDNLQGLLADLKDIPEKLREPLNQFGILSKTGITVPAKRAVVANTGIILSKQLSSTPTIFPIDKAPSGQKFIQLSALFILFIQSLKNQIDSVYEKFVDQCAELEKTQLVTKPRFTKFVPSSDEPEPTPVPVVTDEEKGDYKIGNGYESATKDTFLAKSRKEHLKVKSEELDASELSSSSDFYLKFIPGLSKYLENKKGLIKEKPHLHKKSFQEEVTGEFRKKVINKLKSEYEKDPSRIPSIIQEAFALTGKKPVVADQTVGLAGETGTNNDETKAAMAAAERAKAMAERAKAVTAAQRAKSPISRGVTQKVSAKAAPSGNRSRSVGLMSQLPAATAAKYASKTRKLRKN